MSTASNGRAREYRVRDLLVQHGWVCVMRAAGSRGAGDLLMGHPSRRHLLLQVGTEQSKALGPAARQRFLTAARLIQAHPIVALTSRNGTRFLEINDGPPSEWTLYEPF